MNEDDDLTANMPPQQHSRDASSDNVEGQTEPSTLSEPLLESTPSQPSPSTVVSRNVTLTLVHTFFTFIGNSIWGANVLPAYIFLLTDNNPEAIGTFMGCMGLSNVLCSIPTGWFADSYRRDVSLKLASLVGILAIATALMAIWLENGSYRYLLAAGCLWGCSRGIGNTALFALFSDSVPKGNRSEYFTKRNQLIKQGIAAGPITTLLMFYFMGDHWSARECAIVITIGQVVSLPPMILFSFFNDDDAVPESIDNPDHQGASDENIGLRERTSAHASDDEPVDNESLNDEPVDEGSSESSCCIKACCGCMRKRRIATLVASGDVLSGIAGGLCIRYFPIFFLHSLKLGPVIVQVLYLSHPLLQVYLVQVAQRLSMRCGRLHVAAWLKWIGALTMYLMIGAYHAKFPLWVVCLLFVIRTAVANSTKALTKSVLMDAAYAVKH